MCSGEGRLELPKVKADEEAFIGGKDAMIDNEGVACLKQTLTDGKRKQATLGFLVKRAETIERSKRN